jgi:hypothetical protein
MWQRYALALVLAIGLGLLFWDVTGLGLAIQDFLKRHGMQPPEVQYWGEVARVVATVIKIIVVFILTSLILSFLDRFLSKRDQQQLIHEQCSRRLDNILKYHALYTRDRKLETILGNIEQTNGEVRWAMARMVSDALSTLLKVGVTGHTTNEITLDGQDYGQFSWAFQRCLTHCNRVTLTCIYAPKNWFSVLKQDVKNGEKNEDRWGIFKDVNLKDLDPTALAELSPEGMDTNAYPSHYLSFLTVEDPLRIFLLDQGQWSSLIQEKVAYQKFIRPCKDRKKMKTVFVNVLQFLKRYKEKGATLDHDAAACFRNDPWLQANLDDMGKFDLNLFGNSADMGNSAAMEWTDGRNPPGADGRIRLLFGGTELDAYTHMTKFLEYLAGDGRVDDWGIFTPQTLEATSNCLK